MSPPLSGREQVIANLIEFSAKILKGRVRLGCDWQAAGA